MGNSIQLIEGGKHSDERGTIAFINDFDLTNIVRFYRISHPSISIVRAWQGHQKESKWFHCNRGSFLIKLMKIDNWEEPSRDLVPQVFELKSSQSQVLYIPPGYASGFKALEKDSSILVFSDLTTEESKEDDFRFEKNYWFNWD